MATNKVHRRPAYQPRAKYPVYHDTFDKLMIKSKILNGGSETIPNVHTILWDRQNLEVELYRIIGNENGRFKKGNESHIAYLPFVRMKLELLTKKFEEWSLKRKLSGYADFTQWPEDLLIQKYQIEAQEDLLIYEAEVIEKRISSIQEESEKEDESKLLIYGLRCNYHFWGTKAPRYEMINMMKDIDGQKVSMRDDELIIQDERSPYNGLSVADYRELSKVWLAEQRRIDKEKLETEQRKCKEQGLPVPNTLSARSPKRVNLSSLPPFPENCVNHLKELKHTS